MPPVPQIQNPFIAIPKPVRGIIGGMNVNSPADDLADRESPDMLNLIPVKKLLRVDTGYKKFRQTVRGVPQKSFVFNRSTGAANTVLITTQTMYVDTGAEWEYVSNGTSTNTT